MHTIIGIVLILLFVGILCIYKYNAIQSSAIGHVPHYTIISSCRGIPAHREAVIRNIKLKEITDNLKKRNPKVNYVESLELNF